MTVKWENFYNCEKNLSICKPEHAAFWLTRSQWITNALKKQLYFDYFFFLASSWLILGILFRSSFLWETYLIVPQTILRLRSILPTPHFQLCAFYSQNIKSKHFLSNIEILYFSVLPQWNFRSLRARSMPYYNFIF